MLAMLGLSLGHVLPPLYTTMGMPSAGWSQAALLSQGLCEHSPATVAALRSLHPTAPAPTAPAMHEEPVAPGRGLRDLRSS